MLIYHRRFIPNAINLEFPLHDLKIIRIGDRTPISWFAQTENAFNACMNSTANEALLVHLQPNLPIAFVTDALDVVIAAMLE